jgi:hypothetical protein
MCCLADVGEVQYRETKRAFYAGAAALFAEINNMLDSGIEPTETDIANLDYLHGELVSFNNEVKAGRA